MEKKGDSAGKMPLDIAREQAKQGDAEAMYQLGRYYLEGKGVEQNKEIASDWWLRAAMKGYIPACHELGLYYFFLKNDAENAIKWLNKSASANYAPSYLILGNIYISGWDGEPDIKKALEFSLKAVELGEWRGAIDAAKIYLTGEEGVVDVDYDKAIELLQIPVYNGDIYSCFALGYALNAKCEMVNSYSWEMVEKAFGYMMKAAMDGYPEAMFRVAYSYMEGRGVIWDMDKAREWFDKSLAKEYRVDDINDIISKYYSGDGSNMLYPSLAYWHQIIENNPDKITEKEPYTDEEGYMNQSAVARGAAQCGDVNAAAYLGYALMDSDPDKAWDYFDVVIRHGYTNFAENVGKEYYTGKNVKQDLARAARYFAYGSELGDIQCTLSLGMMLTSDGVSKEMEEKGKVLLQSVCEASNEDTEVYRYAKTQLDRLEQRDNSTISKLSEGLKSMFGKNK